MGTDTWAAVRTLSGCGRPLVIAVGDVTQMDASGIGVFADLIRRWRGRGGSTSIVGARDSVARLLQLSKICDAAPGGPQPTRSGLGPIID